MRIAVSFPFHHPFVGEGGQADHWLAAAGLAEVYAPFDGSFNNTYGLGLCSYLLQSDE